MRWDYSDEYDDRIQETSDWLPIENYKELQARSGVYIFADNYFDVQYIGKAGAGRMIVEEAENEVSKMLFEIYSAIYRKKDFNATQVIVFYTNSDDIALALEGELIKKYSPANNGKQML